MAHDRRTLSALAALLPAGTLGLSVSLAAAGAKATTVADPAPKAGLVAERLQSIRDSVSGALTETPNENGAFLKVDPETKLAWWGNGWHGGGWGNGGWHNGGWGNGGWGNGWHNWGNGWHNW
jgi:rSAM-associated Gly-rich repeat protein